MRSTSDEQTAADDAAADDVGPPAALADCEARLSAESVRFKPARLPPHTHGALTCGAPQVVEYAEGPEHVHFRPKPTVTCQLALGLARFERTLQRTALEYFKTRVVSVVQGGTYNCRLMARFSLVSEHSYANAIDLYAFKLADGRSISVAKNFGDPKREPTSTESKFLRELARRLYDENVFSVVVTRYFDELHWNHIHVDMARYRTDGTR